MFVLSTTNSLYTPTQILEDTKECSNYQANSIRHKNTKRKEQMPIYTAALESSGHLGLTKKFK